ncbi:MAG: AAA family ATPase [Bacilli bacterium]|nr:AAA family ATPase [Bacilli bacterium]
MKRIKGKTMCIFSAKGGVGKTITAINLAGIFESLEKKVLIIDLDFSGGGIALALNKPFEKNIYNFVDDYTNNRYHDFKEYVTHFDDYIDILPSPKDPRQGMKIDSKYAEIVIDKAKYMYDVVLIDTNHFINEFNILTLDQVDNILFMVTNDPLDIKNMRSLISIFKDIGETNYKVLLNNSRDPYKKYFSMYDIKNILKANIDYTLTSNFFIKEIDTYVMDGKIITLDKKMPNVFNKDYHTFMLIAKDLLKDTEEEINKETKEDKNE